MTLLYIVAANLIVSLLSLFALLILILNRSLINKTVIYLVSLSAGVMLGNVFFHLLPEALDVPTISTSLLIILLSFIFFLILELFLNWHHCHKKNFTHSVGYLNLIADLVHNYIDGLVIAGAFILNTKLGVVTTVAIALHEVPQELGDIGVLIHSGFSKYKALLLNLLIALFAVLGGLSGFYFFRDNLSFLPYLISFAAGSFLYISASDLIPEIKHTDKIERSLNLFLIFMLGILIMYVSTFLE